MNRVGGFKLYFNFYVNNNCTVQIFLSVDLISFPLYRLVEDANYYEDFGSNSYSFEAMNIVVAPISWNSHLGR